MFSTKHFLQRSLLLAGAVALPLVGGAALAQTTTPAPAAPSTTAGKTEPGKTEPGKVADKTDPAKDLAKGKSKQLGAMKATPAEKKAAHDKAMKLAKTGTDKKTPNDAKAVAASGGAAKPAASAPVTQ